MINKEKMIARKITLSLHKRGFLVEKHKSKTSKSIYLKIDNGIIPTIRISDHKRYNNDNCKFNVIKNFPCSRSEIVDGKIKKYYNFHNLGRLITDMELERNTKILNMGYSKYVSILKGKKSNTIFSEDLNNRKVA